MVLLSAPVQRTLTLRCRFPKVRLFLIPHKLPPLPPISEAEATALLAAARKAMANAYAPYSNVRVGAAIMAASGRIWTGANIGNSCSTLNCCAEQSALMPAVLAQDFPLRAVAVVQSSGEACPPCGRCLQLISEFASDADIIAHSGKEMLRWRLKQLHPVPYRRSN